MRSPNCGEQWWVEEIDARLTAPECIAALTVHYSGIVLVIQRVILQHEYHGVLHSSVLVLQCVAVAVELFQGKSGIERWMATAAAAEETALSPIF